MNPQFISICGNSSHLNLTLFEGSSNIDSVLDCSSRASSALIPQIDSLLKKNSLRLENLDFMAVDHGPGAFTSLRVIIATVNGIAFNKNIPLIGVNALEALVYEGFNSIKDFTYKKPIIRTSLLNAYNNDVYFLIAKSNGSEDNQITVLDQGCKKIDAFLSEVTDKFEGHQVFFNGQGTNLHKALILEKLGKQALIPESILSFASAESIGQLALKFWEKRQNITYQIKPLYLKTQYFALRK